MQVRFYIERRRDEAGNLILTERPVIMSVSFHGHRVMLGTGLKVDLNGWDPEKQRIRNGYPDSITGNAWLDTLAETARKTWTAILLKFENPGVEDFRSLFHERKPQFSAGYFDVFIRFLESGSVSWSTATYRKVKTIYKHLREFEAASGFRLSFSNMDAAFVEKYKAFYTARGNAGTTTRSALNIIVWFLNWSGDKGYHSNHDYHRFFHSITLSNVSQGNKLFLKWDEIKLLNKVICATRREERVRDMFCFMCYTGLRFSELQALKKEDMGDNELVIRNWKGKVRRVPLSGRAEAIQRAYKNKYYINNSVFPSMSIITMNKYLRLLGKEAGLDRQVLPAPGSVERIPLYERITAGMAVQTFIACAIELEVPAGIIANFTGIRNDSRVERISLELSRREIKKLDQI